MFERGFKIIVPWYLRGRGTGPTSNTTIHGCSSSLYKMAYCTSFCRLFKNNIYLTFGCAVCSWLSRGLALVAASSSCSWFWSLGFSLQWLLFLWSTVLRRTGFSSCRSRTLECRLGSCGTWTQLPHSEWNPVQGWNPCPLHWQACSYRRVPPGDSPPIDF